MRDDLKWPTLHAYRNAAAAGAVPPILCPDCGGELIPRPDSDTLLPVLLCMSCDTVFRPGMGVWDQIARNVSEAVKNIKEKND